jgi:hypothetical protein
MHWNKSLVIALIVCISAPALAQQKFDYRKSWKTVDSLVLKRGLTRSALTQTEKIYKQAMLDKNEPEQIKALIYRMALQRQTVENSDSSNIRQLEKEIAAAKQPARSILQSIAAEQYWNFLQQNRWRFYDRTQTFNFNKEDIYTWSIEDLHEKISSLYLRSVEDEKLLQDTKLSQFDTIIDKGNARHLRPTLFDFLANRAIGYFQNDERLLTKPAYAFEMNDEAAFADAREFASHTFITKDSTALHLRALQLYQSLLRFHLNDKEPDALIDADVNRIIFVKQHAVMASGDSLYLAALQRIAEKYPLEPTAAQASYLLAQHYANEAREYDPNGDTTSRFLFIKAKTICEQILKQKENSIGKANATALLKEIEKKEIQLQIENVNLPSQPFRMLVSYRNDSSAHFRIVKADRGTIENLGTSTWKDEYWERLLRLPVLKTFSQSLPDTKDHQPHKAEVKVDALPPGAYAIIASTDKSFDFKNTAPLVVAYFHVSSIAYINNGDNFYVLHRETGQPLKNAKVKLWQSYYDYQKSRQNIKLVSNLTTNNDGFFNIPKNETSDNRYDYPEYQLEISHNNDYLFLNERAQTYVYRGYREEADDNDVREAQSYEKQHRKVYLFTDRAIYRPGQTVYFKGIAVTRDFKTKQYKSVKQLKTKVLLHDANAQQIDSLELTTNEYGSYHGKFVLTSNSLNGEFQITDENADGVIEFSVEEYKRPKFFVEIQKPQGTYRINDTIRVTGSVKAYAGYNLNDAEVSYRVVRKMRWPIWRYSYSSKIWPPYSTEEVEVSNGETSTDENGNFFISFKAIPDKKISKELQPIFHYEIIADVTDINGETRSDQSSVAVSYQALQVAILAPQKLSVDSLKNIQISTTNINDLFEKATVSITMHKLQEPDRIFRERYWEEPDQFVMSREEYYRMFPHDVYKDEHEMRNWPREKRVLEGSDTTAATFAFPVFNRKLQKGSYVIEATTKDKYGELVKAEHYIELTDDDVSNGLAFGRIEAKKNEFEPGEKASYQLSTNLDKVFAIHQQARSDSSIKTELIEFSKGTKSFTLPIEEKDRGGIHLNLAFIRHNRVYTHEFSLDVPFNNKKLDVHYKTYRDKTLPGSKETWTVTIQGKKGEKLAAEMLTGMYDASLDQFRAHDWIIPSLWSRHVTAGTWTGKTNFKDIISTERYIPQPIPPGIEKQYDQLVSMHSIYYAMERRVRGVASKVTSADVPAALEAQEAELSEVAVLGYSTQKSDSTVAADAGGSEEAKEPNQSIQIRKNFNETAFFFPDLKTDSNGNISFSFTMPEATTEWKWMTLAHTPELAFGYKEASIITQKQLMVQPNAPRFFREGDRMDFSGKIVNLTDKELTGQVELQLIDPSTNESIDGWFRNFFPNQYFTAPAGQSVPVSFSIEVPYQFAKPVVYRIIARSDTVSDGEESILPVLSNRIQVTESITLPLTNTSKKQFTFDKLLKSGESETLTHHALTVEFTSNPAWYAIQSLPYLMEYPYECAEQVFNRFYANALASHIVRSSPRIEQVFEKWKISDTAALMSNLQKNEELKSVLLQETPWVVEAKSETEQKKKIALLFDMVRMSEELQSSINKLRDMQTPNGAFPWFKGGPEDRYITQYIITGIGHLRRLKAIPASLEESLSGIMKAGVSYADKKLQEVYEESKKRNKTEDPGLSYVEIQYLYMRSFFTDIDVPGTTFKAYNYYRKESQSEWVKRSRYMQGMIALSLFKTGDIQTAKNIVASLKENAIVHEELGMYWKDVNRGFYWYQSPIETQALLIEAFSEITKDEKSVNNLKTWLLKNKQTNSWSTTKATADACYALLLKGTDWLSNTPTVRITLGDMTISSDSTAEAGTGYFKNAIEGAKVKSSMGNVEVFVQSPKSGAQVQPSWGAVYWQYFEELERITPSATPLKLSKKLFVEKNTDRGPVLQAINNGDIINVGDKLIVRIELRSDRDLEYVHMKDMRASSTEPVNVISSYKWQDGLGYYESTKDASTNFFFNWLPKGTYVFQYPLFVTHSGTYNSGISSIQCMYAPEFTSHSENIKLNIEAQR